MLIKNKPNQVNNSQLLGIGIQGERAVVWMV